MFVVKHFQATFYSPILLLLRGLSHVANQIVFGPTDIIKIQTKVVLVKPNIISTDLTRDSFIEISYM